MFVDVRVGNGWSVAWTEDNWWSFSVEGLDDGSEGGGVKVVSNSWGGELVWGERGGDLMR